MRIRILIFILFLVIRGEAQDSLAIVRTIDSIWAQQTKTTNKKFKGETANTNYRVWYDKETKEVLLVTVSHHNVPGEETKTLIYNYHFRHGKLIFLTKYNNAGAGDSRRKVCYYYFTEDALLYRHEYRTSVPDISAEQQNAYVLKKRFTKQ